MFPADPPRFLARTPHGYHDLADHRSGSARTADSAHRRTSRPSPPRSRAASPRAPAVAYCQGTPLRNEIEARDAGRGSAEATDMAAEAIARRFGTGPVDGKIQAHIVTVAR